MRLPLILRLRFRLVCLAVLMSSCSMLPPKSGSVPYPLQPESAPFAMNGRISINYQEKRQTAGLRWVHLAHTDEILLLTPLGQTAARVYRDAQQATLDSGSKHFQAVNIESLMDRELGWYLPLRGLHHWVLGRADTVDPAQVERNDNGQITLLCQAGWEVRYLQYADNQPDSLPVRLQLTNEGMQVQLLIDEWDWSLQ